MFRRIIFAALGASAALSPAAAADLGGLKDGPYVSQFTWAGPYVGLNTGYGWGSGEATITPLPSAARFNDLLPQKLDPDPDGFLGGLQAGHNWQTGAFVLGAEVDIQAAGIKGDVTETPIITNAGGLYGTDSTLTIEQKLDWFGTARLRAGITPTTKSLLYATGGLAYAHISNEANADFRTTGTVQYPADNSGVRTGWALGGGLEWAYTPDISFKAEYLHMDFGTTHVTADPSPANPPYQVQYDFDSKVDVVRVGMNVKIH